MGINLKSQLDREIAFIFCQYFTLRDYTLRFFGLERGFLCIFKSHL